MSEPNIDGKHALKIIFSILMLSFVFEMLFHFTTQVTWQIIVMAVVRAFVNTLIIILAANMNPA